jgi:uncharacterized protein
MTNKTILQFILGILIVYIGFGLFLFFDQKSMIYLPSNQIFEECSAFQDYLQVEYGGTKFYFKQNSNNVIIHYHGNAGSACDRSIFKPIFEKSNSPLIFVEYTGFSGDGKKPSMKKILRDVENVNEFISEKSFDDVIVYGESLGSGPASYHAKISKVDTLILTSPFTSVKEVAQNMYKIYPAGIIVTENFDNINMLKDYENKLIIFHGKKDREISYKYSEKLFNNVNTKNKEIFLIEDFGHNDLFYSEFFKNKLTELIKVKK